MTGTQLMNLCGELYGTQCQQEINGEPQGLRWAPPLWDLRPEQNVTQTATHWRAAALNGSLC